MASSKSRTIADALNDAQISNLCNLGSITGLLNDYFNFDENNLSATESDSDFELESVSDGSIEMLRESVDSLTNPDQVNLVRGDNCSNDDDDASGVVEEANPEEEAKDVDEMDELMEKVATSFRCVNSDRSVELRKISLCDCKCSDNKRGQCMKALDPECIYDIRLSMQEMTRHERDLVLLGKISSFTMMSGKTQCSKRKMQTDRKQPQSTWIIHGTKVCRIAFLFISNISNDKLLNVMKWYKENGLVPRYLKSGGRREIWSLSHSDIVRIVSFIKYYGEDNAISLPGCIPGQKNFAVKLLPSNTTRSYVFHSYKNALSEGERAVKKITWYRLWKTLIPYIVTLKPMSDLCWDCQRNHSEIYLSNNLPAVVKLAKLKKQEHRLAIVDQERCASREMVSNAKATISLEQVENLSPNAPCSRPITMHYSFDFVQ